MTTGGDQIQDSPEQHWVTPALDASRRNPLAERRQCSISRRRGALVSRALIASDVVAFAAAFLFAEYLFGIRQPPVGSRLTIATEATVFFATLPASLLLMRLYGLYSRDEQRADHSTADDFMPVLHLVTMAVWLSQGVSRLTGLAHPQFAKLVTFWAAAVTLVILGRGIARQILRSRATYIQNTLILGADDVGQLIARKLLHHPEYGLNVVGFAAEKAGGLHSHIDHLPVLGQLSDVGEMIRSRDIERVIVAGIMDETLAVRTIHELKGLQIQVDIVPRLFEVVGPGVDLHAIEGVPLLGLPRARLSRTSLLFKRTIDIVVSVVALLAFLPVFGYIAIRIKRDSPGPVFFRQLRLGLNMRSFPMLKFRSMTVGASDETHRDYIKEIMDSRVGPGENGLYKLERPVEITPFGRWLRQTSVDELPQLLNVLKGDMSLVGPRPCLAYEVDHFAPHHFERFSVPAGMTGLWQVTARARSTFLEALEMDVAYARGWSISLDLWLLARTPLQLLMQRGAG